MELATTGKRCNAERTKTLKRSISLIKLRKKARSKV
jgi:hypothetical protein